MKYFIYLVPLLFFKVVHTSTFYKIGKIHKVESIMIKHFGDIFDHLDTTDEFNGVFTTLDAICNKIEDLTVTANVTIDLNSVFTLLKSIEGNVESDFKGVFTALNSIFNEIKNVTTDFNNVFTVLAHLDATERFNGVFTVLDHVNEDVHDNFEGVFTTLDALRNQVDNLTVTANVAVDFNDVFTVLASLDDTEKFNEVFTTLDAICNKIEDLTVTANVTIDLNSVFTLLKSIEGNVESDFKGVFTALNSIFNEIENVTVDFNDVFTVLAHLDATERFNGVFTVLDHVNEDVHDNFEGVFTTLDALRNQVDNLTVTANVTVDFNDVFTVLASLDDTEKFNEVFTTLAKVCEKIEGGFDNTFTVLDTISTNLSSASISLSTATTISLPGNYVLTEDLDVDLDSAIEIASSGVCLDLNGHTISNSGGIGIQVDGQSDVKIKNGQILTVTGIALLDTCTNILIEDIAFIGNDLGIVVEAALGLNIDNCFFRGNQQCMQLSHCKNGDILDCRISENIVPVHIAALVNLFDCNNIVCINLDVSNNTLLDAGAVLALDNCSNMKFRELHINANVALDTLITLSITNSSRMTFNHCEANNNNIDGSILGSAIVGFGVFSSENIAFKQCEACGQEAFDVGADRAIGFLLNSASNCVILNSLASNNRGATESIGILLEDSSNNVLRFNNIITNELAGIRELGTSTANGILTNYAEGSPTNFDLIGNVPITMFDFTTGIISPLLGSVTVFDNISV